MGKEEVKAKMEELTAKLEAGIKSFTDSDNYKLYLKTVSKFHSYSLNNTLLIMLQKPEATYVTGYKTWVNDFERQVKKGEKAIQIFAPSSYTVTVMQTKTDSDGKPVLDANGEPVKEPVTKKMHSFRLVPVFDLSQTEGKEFPNPSALIGVNELTGEVEGFDSLFAALCGIAPVPVEMEKITSGAKGYCSDTRIAINKGMSELQTLKTLVHELAHSFLHHGKPNGLNSFTKEHLSREEKEVEAESVAYIVCNYLGFDTSDYSFGYIGAWGNQDMKELKNSLDKIRKTASMIIKELDARELEAKKEEEEELAM